MNLEKMLIATKISAVIGAYSFIRYLVEAFSTDTSTAIIGWRIVLLIAATAATVGLFMHKNWARWLQFAFSLLTLFNASLYLTIAGGIPGATINKLWPVAVIVLNLLSVAALIICKSKFIPLTVAARAQRQRYATVLVAVLLVTASSTVYSEPGNPLAVDSMEKNHGTVLRGAALQNAFTILNDSESELKLEAHASCGCTILQTPKTLAPKHSAKVSYYIHTFNDRPGDMDKTIVVGWTVGVLHGNLRLSIKYNIAENFLIYQNERYITPKQQVAILVWQWKSATSEIKAIAPNSLFDFTLEKLNSKRGEILRLTAKPFRSLAGLGGQTEYAQLVTSNGTIYEIPFSISGDYQNEEQTAVNSSSKRQGS
jgi:hypothetical protein